MMPEIILQKNGIEFTESAMCYCEQADVIKSMKEYAEQKAIEFANWLHEKWYKWGSDNLWWHGITNTGGYTTKELYDVFIKTK